jgi:hypothetical protein
MYQAISTKYIGPTNHRGARVKAFCEAGSIIVPWAHGLTVIENHRAAAVKLATNFKWSTDFAVGSTSGWGYCFVRLD